MRSKCRCLPSRLPPFDWAASRKPPIFASLRRRALLLARRSDCKVGIEELSASIVVLSSALQSCRPYAEAYLLLRPMMPNWLPFAAARSWSALPLQQQDRLQRDRGTRPPCPPAASKIAVSAPLAPHWVACSLHRPASHQARGCRTESMMSPSTNGFLIWEALDFTFGKREHENSQSRDACGHSR